MQTDAVHIAEGFMSFLTERCKCSGRESFLLAVSGGIDSMVMLDLFHRNGLKFAIAHCNFSLRGKESDVEEEFVRQTAGKLKKAFFTRKFDTQQVAGDKGISIQMAARELRYQWFSELARDHNYDLIATAHHQDDSVETFLINLSRGTGITGLTGIKPRNGKLVRPMLFLSRLAIRSFAKSMEIAWKEDSSNATVKYLRNKIRHILLPEIKKALPGFDEAVIKTMAQLQETKDLLDTATAQFMKETVTGNAQRMKINIAKIGDLPSSGILLYEVLQQFGFHYDTVERLFGTLKGQPGKQFFSRSHELTVDRSFLIIQPLQQGVEDKIEIQEGTAAIQYPVNLTFRLTDNLKSFDIPADSDIASLDMDTIRFPLILRRWKKGDYFCPLGMKGRKKLSDFFVDEKIALPDKKRIWILESAGNIIWVVGLRIDERNKVTASTGKIMQIVYHNGDQE